AARPAVPALGGLVPALGRQDARPCERELLDRDRVLLLVARRHVARLEARVVGAEREHVAGADVARAQALGPREPRGREQRAVARQELDLAHRRGAPARHTGQRHGPVPPAVAAHRAREPVGDETFRLGDRPQVLAHVLGAVRALLGRGARELDRAREHGIPRGTGGDPPDALLGGCHGDHRQASISSATARRTAATLVALPFSGYRPRRRPLPIPSSSLMRSSTMTAISSAERRFALTTDGVGSRSVTASACGPRRPSATPKSTRAPGFGAGASAGSAEACRKTSPPSSLAMKPNPRSVSNHLTLPVGT